MDSQNIKIYEPQLVIHSIDVSGVTAKITCIECTGSRMFIGTMEGAIMEYFITDERSKNLFSKVRQINLNKGLPIVHIRSASALDSLIILSGGLLALYDIQTLEAKGSNNISSISAIAIDENPINGDPFVVEFCFSRRKSITTAKATEKGFQLLREIGLDSNVGPLAIEAGLVCAALTSGRYIFLNMNATRKSVQDLCDFDPKEGHPNVIHVGKEEFLVIGPGGLGVFVTSRGTSERAPINWTEKVKQMTVDGLNVVAVGSEALYINSLHDPTTNNSIPFPGIKCLALSEGNLYVGTTRSLYRFRPVSVEDQVEALLASEEVDRAFALVQKSELKQDHEQYLLRKIHRKAVFVRLSVFDFPLALESVKESRMDMREVISLFPKILPNSSTFTRSLPPLHNFLDVNQLAKEDTYSINELYKFALDMLFEDNSITSSKDLSTAIIKLSAKLDKPKFITILQTANQMNIDYEDCLEWMKEFKMYDCSAHLYKAHGDYRKALDLWIQLAQGYYECNESDSFEGLDVIVDTLLSSTDESLVWTYYEKLAKLNPSKAVEVFSNRPVSTTFPSLKVAEKLHPIRKNCLEYLEHCVEVKKLKDEDIHTYLAIIYIEEITESGKETMREKFQQFLINSNHLKVQFLIGRLMNSKLRLELAILHGKAGDHTPALTIFVRDLGDHKLAREYCRKVQQPSQRKRAFLDLLDIYLQTEERGAISKECHDLLSDFGEEFDLSSVLHLFPDEWSLTVMSSLLHRAMRIQLHIQRKSQLVKGLAERIHLDYTLEMHEGNQGYRVDDESVCAVCSRRFDSIEPIMYKKGAVVHSKCV